MKMKMRIIKKTKSTSCDLDSNSQGENEQLH